MYRRWSRLTAWMLLSATAARLAHVTRNFYSLPRDVTRCSVRFSDRFVYPPDWRTSRKSEGRLPSFPTLCRSRISPRRRRSICKQRLEEVYGKYRDAIDTRKKWFLSVPYCARKALPCRVIPRYFRESATRPSVG